METSLISLKSICGCLTDLLANRFKGYSIVVKAQTITDISRQINTKWLNTALGQATNLTVSSWWIKHVDYIKETLSFCLYEVTVPPCYADKDIRSGSFLLCSSISWQFKWFITLPQCCTSIYFNSLFSSNAQCFYSPLPFTTMCTLRPVLFKAVYTSLFHF